MEGTPNCAGSKVEQPPGRQLASASKCSQSYIHTQRYTNSSHSPAGPQLRVPRVQGWPPLPASHPHHHHDHHLNLCRTRNGQQGCPATACSLPLPAPAPQLQTPSQPVARTAATPCSTSTHHAATHRQHLAAHTKVSHCASTGLSLPHLSALRVLQEVEHLAVASNLHSGLLSQVCSMQCSRQQHNGDDDARAHHLTVMSISPAGCCPWLRHKQHTRVVQ